MPEPEAAAGERQSFLQHLEELRRRLLRAAIAIAVGFGVCNWQIERIFGWLILPLKRVMKGQPGKPLQMITATEGFMTNLKLAVWAGILLASPVVLYQIWSFVAPGLYRRERRLLAPLVVASTLLFLAGAAFTYFVVLPFGLEYLLEFSTADVEAKLQMSAYVSFTCMFMALFGLIFQVPIIMLVLGRLGIVKASLLARNRKYVLLGSFIIGAILTPPDVVSQCLMSIPLFLLFEVSIWLMRLQDLLRRRREAAEAGGGEAPAG